MDAVDPVLNDPVFPTASTALFNAVALSVPFMLSICEIKLCIIEVFISFAAFAEFTAEKSTRAIFVCEPPILKSPETSPTSTAHKLFCETLEEAVNNFKKTDVYINEIKQAQERMYSEEDLKEAYFSAIESTGEGWNGEYAKGNSPDIEEIFGEGFIEWFEQFKKK